MEKRNWTEDEESYMKEHYRTDGCKAVAKHLGISYHLVARKALNMSLAKKQAGDWDYKEESYLRRYYNKIPISQLCKHLKRTPASVRNKAALLLLTKSAVGADVVTYNAAYYKRVQQQKNDMIRIDELTEMLQKEFSSSLLAELRACEVRVLAFESRKSKRIRV